MANQTRLDETFFAQPEFGLLHSNSILFYFATSPFFDQSSKNALIYGQGISNPDMWVHLATREAFEAKVKERTGIEFVVAQEPAESGPNQGTGVWVINRQRREFVNNEERVTVEATYFVVGYSIYMAPTFADVMSSRMAAISSSVSKILPTAESAQKWTPAQGRINKKPATSAKSKIKTLEAKDPNGGSTPLPMADSVGGVKQPVDKEKSGAGASDYRVLEEAIDVHMRYGNDYMDQNPITGRPGEFKLSTSGRKEQPKPAAPVATLALPKATPGTAQGAGVAGGLNSLPALNTKVEATQAAGKNGKETKSPKTPNLPNKKRRKSKMGGTTPGATPS